MRPAAGRSSSPAARSTVFAAAIVVWMGWAASTAQAQEIDARADRPMVISISWSSPDVQYLRQHLHEWEERPFTGTLVHLYKWPYAEAGCVEMGSGDGLSWSAFQKHRFTDEMFEETIRLLKATPSVRRNDILLWIVSYLQDAPKIYGLVRR